MSKYREYLTQRIEELTQSHKVHLKASISSNMNDVHPSISDMHSSNAANIWDTKCELEKALTEYDKLNEQPETLKLFDGMRFKILNHTTIFTIPEIGSIESKITHSSSNPIMYRNIDMLQYFKEGKWVLVN